MVPRNPPALPPHRAHPALDHPASGHPGSGLRGLSAGRGRGVGRQAAAPPWALHPVTRGSRGAAMSAAAPRLRLWNPRG